ncbi:MAG: S9 family peptidase [Planctomycetota bacterium]|nr:S9 family peptidase [Planctomycetota bacterium]
MARRILSFLPLLFLAAPFLGSACSTSQVRTARADSQVEAATMSWSPQDVETLRSVTAVALSPDGAQVAYTLAVPRTAWKDEDGTPWIELHVLDFASGVSRPFVTGKVNVGRIAWMPDSKSIAYLAKREGDKETALYAVRTDGGESRKVASLDTSISTFSFSPDGSEVALVAPEPVSKERKAREDKGFKQQVYEEDGAFSRVWIAATKEGAAAPRRLAVEGHVHQCVWSPVDTRLALAVAPTPLVDDEYMRTRVRVVDSKDGTVLHRIENPGKLGTIGWTPDAKWVATIMGSDLHDPAATTFVAWASEPNSGPVMIQPLGDNWEGAAVAFDFQPDGHALIVAAKGCETSFEKVNVANAGAQKTLVPAGAAIFNGASVSNDGQTAAFVAHTPRHTPEVYTMRHGDAGPKRRTISNPLLENMEFAKQEVVRWKARDGLELEGVLVHPAGEKAGQRYPLILSVHGGPEAHESNGWATNYSRPGQIAAAKGFAVFYPNYRGSTGRGVAFQKSSQGDAGGKEFDDLVDAVDHLVSIGLVDKDKVGVTGGSYGGYATAWCSTKLTQHFAAGVMFVGISDKFSKFGTTDIPEEEFNVHALKRVWDDVDHSRERSPITYAAQSKTPLLILHGKDDPRVDPGQSRTMYRHMKLRSQAPVRLVLYPGEGHGNRKAASRLDYAVRMMQWFEHYLQGPGGAMPPYEVDYAEKPVAAG